MKAFYNNNYCSLIHDDGFRCDYIYNNKTNALNGFDSLERYIEIIKLSTYSRTELLNLLKDASDWRKQIHDFAWINDEIDVSLKMTVMAAKEILDVKKLTISTILYKNDGIQIIDEII